jgi:hypothetical protein
VTVRLDAAKSYGADLAISFDQREALHMLAGSPNGSTESILERRTVRATGAFELPQRNSRNIVSRHVAASTRLARSCARLQYKLHKLTTLFLPSFAPKKARSLTYLPR